ncbi:hypothetical protein COPG_00128 [Colwellia phage 9A]|uniref:Uncharacterized protein n=1 Tax=Colwellia phage 9A TaxID=765765 RepID=I3UMK9_9CAUD|nr:hypothetical protein COPG_00128 [Colwellia phage 9A]AFK66724.1 hypothetical protein COPG_00128 [Colwellia phage 9A]
MRLVNWSDHDIARLVHQHKLKLVIDKINNTNYYHSENYALEILIIFNNKDNTRQVIYSSNLDKMKTVKA